MLIVIICRNTSIKEIIPLFFQPCYLSLSASYPRHKPAFFFGEDNTIQIAGAPLKVYVPIHLIRAFRYKAKIVDYSQLIIRKTIYWLHKMTRLDQDLLDFSVEIHSPPHVSVEYCSR